jgi:hypothetical protein
LLTSYVLLSNKIHSISKRGNHTDITWKIICRNMITTPNAIESSQFGVIHRLEEVDNRITFSQRTIGTINITNKLFNRFF